MYISSPDLENKIFHTKFRRRFRTLHNSFLELVEECKSVNIFKRWISCDCRSKTSSSAELLMLDALRHLGRG